MREIPDFLKKKEDYCAVYDSTSFIDKSLLSFSSTVIKLKKKGSGTLKENPLVYFIFLVTTILLMSLSRNMLFSYIVLALLVIRLTLLGSEELSFVVISGFRAFIISCLILMPSMIMGFYNTMLTVSLKVFIGVCFLSLFNSSYDTFKLIDCFKYLRVPDLVIYIFDTTIKYIVVFSKSSKELLTALKCRLIGKLKKKDKSITNIMGATYLKSTKMSREMLEAMECRGFTGEYHIVSKFKFNIYDLFRISLVVALIALFIYLEVL